MSLTPSFPPWAIARQPVVISASMTLAKAAFYMEEQQGQRSTNRDERYLDRRLESSHVLAATLIQDSHDRIQGDCAVVVDDDQRVVGLLTHWDLGRWGAQQIAFETTTVGEMLPAIALQFQEADLKDLETAYDLLQHHRVSYVPVVDGTGQLVGVLGGECLRQAMLLRQCEVPQEHTGPGVDFEQVSRMLEVLSQREQGLSKIVAQVHASLDLLTVLGTTVDEVRRLLGCDRVIIYRLREDLSGVVVAESIIPEGRSLLHSEAHDPCITPEWLEPYRRGKVRIVNDIHEVAMTSCHQELLVGLDIRSKLMVPVVVEERLWGLMIASHKDMPRQWQADEISLAEQLAQHGAIAIQQALIYERASTELDKRREVEKALAALNQDLEQTIQARTTELREQKNFIQTVINTIPMPIFWKDRESKFLGANLACAQQLSLTSAEEMVGQTDFDFAVTRPLAEEYRADDRKVMASGQPKLGIVETILTPDDQVMHIETNKAPLRNLQGDVVGMVGIFQDVTERKETEQVIERQLAAIEASVEGIGIAQDGRFLYLNPAHVSLFGYDSPEELLDQTYGILYSPEEQQRFAQEVMPVLAQNGSWQGEAIGTRRDGSTFLQELSLTHLNENLLVCVCRDITDRKIMEAQAQSLLNRSQLLHEVGSAIRASLELNTILENTVESLFRTMDVDICAFGWYQDNSGEKSWEIVTESKKSSLLSWMGEYSLETFAPLLEAIRKDCIYRAESCRDGDLDCTTDKFCSRLFDDLGVYTYLCLPIQTYGGRIGLLQLGRVSWEKRWDPDEVELVQELGIQVAIAIDQSQLYEESQAKNREVEQSYQRLQATQLQLVQAEKMSGLGQLVAGIAHEINNPIGFIYGNLTPAKSYFETLAELVELYQDQCPEPTDKILDFREDNDIDYLLEDFPRLVQSIKNGANRIQKIVQSLRIFSRLDESSYKSVNLHENIDSVLSIIQSRLDGRAGMPPIRLIKNYDGDLPVIECYVSLLNQVFMNLIVNAIDAVDQQRRQSDGEYGGEIRIETRSVGEESVAIAIRDNGIGIGEETKAKIFDPFFTTKPVGVGTGMGLAICYQIVIGNHGGELSCDSTVGEGTVFEIKLPTVMGRVPPVGLSASP